MIAALGVPAIVLSAAMASGLVAYWVVIIRNGARRERAKLRELIRAGRGRLAAVEAGEDDPIFAPEAIERSVADVFGLIQGAWRHRADPALPDRPDVDLIKAWARSRQSWLGGGLRIDGRPAVDVLRVVNRAGDEEDRVVLRVRARVTCERPKTGLRRVRLDERWTLGHVDDRWVLLSVAGDPLAGPPLTAPLIPTRASDTDRLTEESLAELAGAQTLGDDVDLRGLVRADAPPKLALLDLSVLDGRFLPALIGAELGHILEAWEEAVTGSEAPLEALASAAARTALLRPRARARLIVRDLVLTSWEATELDLARRPPTVEVALKIEAIRYVARNNGRSLAGDHHQSHPMALQWVLELTRTAPAPWRLVRSTSPAKSIPGWQ